MAPPRRGKYIECPCGTTFYVPPSRATTAKFCSAECRRRYGYQPEYKGKIEVPCEHCGKVLRRYPSLVKDYNFCDAECFNAYRRRPVIKTCAVCGASFSVKRSEAPTRLTCGWECRVARLRGHNHPSWRGGREPYYGPNWDEQRRKARERNGACHRCGRTPAEIGEALSVHHIKPFREFGYVLGENDNYRQANALENLEGLCRRCHARIKD